MSGGRAIVLSGGGAKGAFQVGVLKELILNRGVSFDIFVGTSTGAIQALGGAKDDITGLEQYWRSIQRNEDIYLNKLESFWSRLKALLFGSGSLSGLFSLESLYDASPLREKLRAYAETGTPVSATGKRLRVLVADLQTGEAQCIREDSPDIADWVYASCAEPVLFEPLRHKDAKGNLAQWIDGGVRDVTPLGLAMAEKPDTVLVVRASPPPAVAPAQGLLSNAFQIGLQSVAILESEVSKNDLDQSGLINAIVNTHDEIETQLQQRVPDPADRAAILQPVSTLKANFEAVPITVLAPDKHFSDSHKFDPLAIQQAIEAGQQAVSDNWPAGLNLQAFLS